MPWLVYQELKFEQGILSITLFAKKKSFQDCLDSLKRGHKNDRVNVYDF